MGSPFAIRIPSLHFELAKKPVFCQVENKMPSPNPKDPLHGVTLEMIINQLVERYGWEELGDAIPIRCFQLDPSVKSSLTFLRRTPWARAKVEELYLRHLPSKA